MLLRACFQARIAPSGNSHIGRTLYGPVYNTGQDQTLVLRTNCYALNTRKSAESCCCLPQGYDPVSQLLLRSKVTQKMEGGKKANMIPNSARTANFCLAHVRNRSRLVNSALHEHRVVSGSHYLAGNPRFAQKPTTACS